VWTPARDERHHVMGVRLVGTDPAWDAFIELAARAQDASRLPPPSHADAAPRTVL
jgi:hypothetical protein